MRLGFSETLEPAAKSVEGFQGNRLCNDIEHLLSVQDSITCLSVSNDLTTILHSHGKSKLETHQSTILIGVCTIITDERTMIAWMSFFGLVAVTTFRRTVQFK